MDILQPIYTEVNDCKDCYKCVRWCPVKSIKVEKDSASIISENCLFCGRCTIICPSGAKKVRDDVSKAQLLIDIYENVVVSLAPSYISEFPDISSSQMIKALKSLGFSNVSETAIGAELVSRKCKQLINENKKLLYISTACPSVVELITKYFPEYVPNLTPILSPMLAHAKILHNQKSIKTKIVFIGPCIAKKVETDNHPELIDVALTFADLRKWFDKEGININESTDSQKQDFYPFKASSSSLYPIDGGMINNMNGGTRVTDSSYMSFSGIGNIKKVLNGLDSFVSSKPLFLELLACEGGCINGPATSNIASLAKKRFDVIKETIESPFPNKLLDLNITQDYYDCSKNISPNFSESEIIEALQTIGKKSKEDELNCGGCGYNSCRDFAQSIIEKKAEQNMCVSYMRSIAQNKATVLLQKIPSGVVMIDDNLNVIESNKNFAKMLGSEIENIYEVNPGLTGASLKKLVSFHKLFSSVLHHGEEILERDIRENGRMFHVSIFSIQKHQIVCGLFRDMSAPEVRKEEVIKRTRKVIKENLSTVQQIAFLLGENASKTEAMLNSIVESHNMSYTDGE